MRRGLRCVPGRAWGGWAVAVLGCACGLVAAPAGARADPPTFSAFSPLGATTQVPGSPFATGAGPDSVTFSPSGQLLATANYTDDTVSMFSVGTHGQLSQVSGSPVATGQGSEPQSVVFSPDGGLLATADGSDAVSVFSVAPGGTLTPVPGSPYPIGQITSSVAFSADGKLLATADEFAHKVSVFSVAADGALTAVPGSPFATGANVYPAAVAFGPSGLLATADENYSTDNGTVSVFSVAANGELTQVPGSPYALGHDTDPRSLAFSARGLLAVGNYDSVRGVSMFSVGSGGTLTQTPGSPYAVRGPVDLAFSPNGGHLATDFTDFESGDDGSVSVLSVAADGALGPKRGIGGFDAGKEPVWVTYSPNGRLLAVANDSANEISVFHVTGPQYADDVLRFPAGDPTSAQDGQSFSEALKVTNRGTERSGSFDTLVLRLPPKRSGVSVTGSDGGEEFRHILQWTVPALKPRQSIEYTPTFQVATSASRHITLFGYVDPSLGNNYDRIRIRLVPGG
jgi:6-phosphogluconolactonase (cycloisomerase 2 family)